jgi:hypothetical protein
MGIPLLIELRKVGDRYLASITLTPLQSAAIVDGGGAQRLTAHGSSTAGKAAALSHAADMAKKILSNPILAAIMPPQAAIAIKAISAISKLAHMGKIGSIWRRFRGPAMRRLAAVIK